MKQTILLTGFEPFNHEPVNPAWEAVRALDGWTCNSVTVVARQLPCVFGEAQDALKQAITDVDPSVVISVGQAGGRADFSVERIAINVDDAPIPDNAARQLVDEPVVAGGPAAYFATLPIKAIVKQLRHEGLPASVSQTAGTFVCNHVFYSLMHHLQGSAVRAGFIHIPYLPEQAARHPGTCSMSLADMIRGLKIAVQVSLDTKGDVHEGAGKIS